MIRFAEDVWNVEFPVLFHLRDLTPDLLEKLEVAAVHADDENGNNGPPIGGYTLEQALIVVFHHGGIEELFNLGILAGWTVERQPEPESWHEAKYPEEVAPSG